MKSDAALEDKLIKNNRLMDTTLAIVFTTTLVALAVVVFTGRPMFGFVVVAMGSLALVCQVAIAVTLAVVGAFQARAFWLKRKAK